MGVRRPARTQDVLAKEPGLDLYHRWKKPKSVGVRTLSRQYRLAGILQGDDTTGASRVLKRDILSTCEKSLPSSDQLVWMSTTRMAHDLRLSKSVSREKWTRKLVIGDHPSQTFAACCAGMSVSAQIYEGYLLGADPSRGIV